MQAIAIDQAPSPTYLVIGGCIVDIVKSSIVKVAANYDVIVNSTGQKILNGGACCQEILAAAGPEVKNQIARLYPKGFEPGD